MINRLRDIIEFANEMAAHRPVTHNSPPAKRFWAGVDTTGDCWVWKGSKAGAGYGVLGIDYKSVYAHRFSYELHFGPIPDNLCVLHKCDNPPCVNPDHLFLGTQLDNMDDRNRKGRTHKGPQKPK